MARCDGIRAHRPAHAPRVHRHPCPCAGWPGAGGRRRHEPAKDTLFLVGGRITKNETRAAAFRRLTRGELGVERRLKRLGFSESMTTSTRPIVSRRRVSAPIMSCSAMSGTSVPASHTTQGSAWGIPLAHRSGVWRPRRCTRPPRTTSETPEIRNPGSEEAPRPDRGRAALLAQGPFRRHYSCEVCGRSIVMARDRRSAEKENARWPIGNSLCERRYSL